MRVLFDFIHDFILSLSQLVVLRTVGERRFCAPSGENKIA